MVGEGGAVGTASSPGTTGRRGRASRRGPLLLHWPWSAYRGRAAHGRGRDMLLLAVMRTPSDSGERIRLRPASRVNLEQGRHRPRAPPRSTSRHCVKAVGFSPVGREGGAERIAPRSSFSSIPTLALWGRLASRRSGLMGVWGLVGGGRDGYRPAGD
jgi:hypothetical protein